MVPEPNIVVSPDGWITVLQVPEGVAFHPAYRLVIQRVLVMLGFGIIMPIVVITLAANSWTGPSGTPLWFIVICVTVFGSIGVAAGGYFWRFKAVPIIAQPNGRVTYGSRILLEPGASQRLYIKRDENSEGQGSFAVVSENRWGPIVRMETPYIGVFATHDAAHWFASRLGGVIGAEVVPLELADAAVLR